jgi:hypothetical protein
MRRSNARYGSGEVRAVFPRGGEPGRRQGRPEAIRRIPRPQDLRHVLDRQGYGQSQRPRHHRTHGPAHHERLAGSIHEFKKLDEDIELRPLLEQLLARPALDIAISEETESRLPRVAGGLSLALARTFRIVDPSLKNPATRQWEQAFQIIDLLL